MKSIYNKNKIINNIQKCFKRRGSGTLVVAISSLIFVMYVTSTYADVRHLKYMQEVYEKNIIAVYSVNVNTVQSDYDKIL